MNDDRKNDAQTPDGVSRRRFVAGSVALGGSVLWGGLLGSSASAKETSGQGGKDGSSGSTGGTKGTTGSTGSTGGKTGSTGGTGATGSKPSPGGGSKGTVTSDKR